MGLRWNAYFLLDYIKDTYAIRIVSKESTLLLKGGGYSKEALIAKFSPGPGTFIRVGRL